MGLRPSANKLKGAFQSGASQHICPHSRISSQDGCCQSLCPQKALQDQQVGLTQAPFKLLSQFWVLECVRFCVYPLIVTFYFLQHSASLENKHHWPSKPNILGAHLPSAGPLGWAGQCRAQTPCFLRKTSAIVLIFLFVGCPLGDVYTTFLPLLLISSWCLLYIFSCRRSFLLYLGLSHQ